jgi:hypothetical protein
MYLYLEFTMLASSVNAAGTQANGLLSLTANHPYAANSGTYMDDTYVTAPTIQSLYPCLVLGTCTAYTVNGSSFYIYRTTIINGWGYTGKGAVDHASAVVKKYLRQREQIN